MSNEIETATHVEADPAPLEPSDAMHVHPEWSTISEEDADALDTAVNDETDPEGTYVFATVFPQLTAAQAAYLTLLATYVKAQ